MANHMKVLVFVCVSTTILLSVESLCWLPVQGFKLRETLLAFTSLRVTLSVRLAHSRSSSARTLLSGYLAGSLEPFEWFWEAGIFPLILSQCLGFHTCVKFHTHLRFHTRSFAYIHTPDTSFHASTHRRNASTSYKIGSFVSSHNQPESSTEAIKKFL